MKAKRAELDVDFIGGQGSLTIDEERALSDFFKQRKLASTKPPISAKQGAAKRPKATA